MKRKDLVLDFTSLLDVIMIILFIVMSNMGQASLDAKEKAQSQIKDAVEIQLELNDSRQNVARLQNDYDNMVVTNENLQKKVEELSKENNLYKAKDNASNVNEDQLYESLMEKTKKITLICRSYVNPNKSDGNAVDVTLYSSENEDEQESLGVVTFTHDLNLTKDERDIQNAEMQNNMYKALENVVKGEDVKLVLVTIEYIYSDKNFSQVDLNNIIGATEDIERTYGVTCYIDKVKQ